MVMRSKLFPSILVMLFVASTVIFPGAVPGSSGSRSAALAASGWSQVNVDGFGDKDNLDVSCMVSLGSRIYAGTYNTTDGPMVLRYDGGTGWTEVSAPGFGQASNKRVTSLAVFENNIYAGVWAQGGSEPGCRVLRYSGGTSWTQVNYSGFQDPDNFDVYSLAVVGGNLYAGTANYADGCQVYRYDGGGAWTRVGVGGFGDPKNTEARCLASFGGKLYVGTNSAYAHGCQVWCYDPLYAGWTKVSLDGFGVPDNYTVRAMAVYNNTLYLGTYSTGMVLRYDGGDSWKLVNQPGFGGGNIITSLYPVGDYLFCGTQNLAGGCEVWRYDGGTWVPLNSDGFGDPENDVVWSLATDGMALFAGTQNWTTGGEVWKTPLTDPRTGLVPFLKADTVTYDGKAVLWGHAGVTSPDAQVKLIEGYTEVASTAPNAYGNFRFDLSGLSLGKHTYYAHVDMLGSSGANSNGVIVIRNPDYPRIEQMVRFRPGIVTWWQPQGFSGSGAVSSAQLDAAVPYSIAGETGTFDWLNKRALPGDPGWSDYWIQELVMHQLRDFADRVTRGETIIRKNNLQIMGYVNTGWGDSIQVWEDNLDFDHRVNTENTVIVGTNRETGETARLYDTYKIEKGEQHISPWLYLNMDPESLNALDKTNETDPRNWNTIDVNMEYSPEVGTAGYEATAGPETISQYLFTLKISPPPLDPSGFVYDISTGRRIVAAEVTCQKMGDGKVFAFWPAEEYEQVNPEYTDFLGYYAWDVPDGDYRVAVGRYGYRSATSEIVYVPPEVLDLDVGLERDGLPYTYFFAEGCTRAGFEEWLCLQNPGEEDALVTVDYMLGTGENRQQQVAVPARSRRTVSVNDFIGPEQDVSMSVSSDRMIVAERPMYYDYKQFDPAFRWTGGHDVVGAEYKGYEFYFAEGCTRPGFEEWICLQNPNDEEAKVQVQYMLGTGENIVKDYAVAPKSRFTVNVNSDVGPDKDVSARVVSTNWVPIMAERPMYFNYRGSWTGGHDVAGANYPYSCWYFAEGCTRAGFEEWLCLQNPGSFPAEVDITYMLGTGENRIQEITVAPHSRYTVDVNAFLGPEQDVSALVYSDNPIVAERPMYFNYHGAWTGGHDVVGATYTKDRWFFAEGCTREGFEEWICIQNPNEGPVDVHITYMLGTGENKTRDLSVPGRTRMTVNAADTVGAGQDVSAMVTSTGGRIICERPMYFDYHGKWTGGHCVVGY